jgi:hypothetical protein
MKTFTTLYFADNVWVLSYIEDDENKQYTSELLDDIKAKCLEYGFSLDFTGALDGSK